MSVSDIAFDIACWLRFGCLRSVTHIVDDRDAISEKQKTGKRIKRGPIWVGHFFVRAAMLRAWKDERRILFPDVCCGCGAPSDCEKIVPSVWLCKYSTELHAVPHCKACKEAQLPRIIAIESKTGFPPEIVRVNLCALTKSFLKTTIELNSTGDVFPPWIPYPNQSPWSSIWRQGNSECWLRFVWDPFFSSLTADERAAYFKRWNAPDDWWDQYAQYLNPASK